MKIKTRIYILALVFCLAAVFLIPSLPASTFASAAEDEGLTSPLESEVVIGDCDGDGRVTVSDLTLLAKYLAGWDVVGENGYMTSPESSPTLYIVGDSTACNYANCDEVTRNYYPLGGYGQYLNEYISNGATVVNLASSGASSKNYITRSEYTTLQNSIGEGDYLFIGFAINDSNQGLNADAPKETEDSFKYYLYNYYIKLAQDVGATPVLVTPTPVRPVDGVSFVDSHMYPAYRQSIQDLGRELDVAVLDLTWQTKELHLALGAAENAYLQTWQTNELSSIDRVHLSVYGAKYVACLLANCINDNIPELSEYVVNENNPPDKEKFAYGYMATELPTTFYYSDGTTAQTNDTNITTSSYKFRKGQS